MSHSLNALYRQVGITKQAVHQHHNREVVFAQRLADLVNLVDLVRAEHPGCGIEKMYYSIQPKFIGRDRFINLFQELGYGLKLPGNYTRTTYRVENEHQNLIEGLVVSSINQVVQSDISYFRVRETLYYLIFIIDVYSKRILGAQASDHMRASANRKALRQIVQLRGKKALINCIHHSDRGSQYNEKQYLKMLEDMNCHVSMGLRGQDNAYAERINGIIKNEYLRHWDIQTLSKLRKKLKDAVKHYNTKRPHNHLPHRYSPIQFEETISKGELNRSHYELIYAEQNYQKRSKTVNLNVEIKHNSGYFCPLFEGYFIVN